MAAVVDAAVDAAAAGASEDRLMIDRMSPMPMRTVLLLAAALLLSSAPALAQEKFKSPDEAVSSLVDAAKAGDKTKLLAVLGPQGRRILSSGDEVADRSTREKFVAAYDARHLLRSDGEGREILILGDDDWPFPIPVIRSGDKWSFDTKAGLEEILRRRIGRNELSAIQVALAYVQAQNEYAALDPAGAGPHVYAQRIVSSRGTKNGLYWPNADGEEPSPLGELAEAATEGYKLGHRPIPYHGYFYRILKRQGASAPGGAFDYVVKGKMIGGFALIAYPAEYGNSGIMTFMVNQDGTVFEKDLGRRTERLASRINSFSPDKTWRKVDTTVQAP